MKKICARQIVLKNINTRPKKNSYKEFDSLRSADSFPVVASLLFFGGREATTGNASAPRRLGI